MIDPIRIAARHLFVPVWMALQGKWRLALPGNPFSALDRADRDALDSRQLRRLRTLLVHAHRFCPYYREQFDRTGIRPDAVDDPTGLADLPLLTKQIVRQEWERLIAGGAVDARWVEDSTGGSSGTPMRFVRDPRCMELRMAQERYFDRWLGYRPGDRMALFVSGSHHEPGGGRLAGRLKDLMLKRMIAFDPTRTDEASIREFASRFAHHHPTYLKCFPNSLAVFARFVEQHGIELPPVDAIACAGENLYPEQRELFERVFGGRVFEKYGTRECGVVACECDRHDGLHVFTEGVLVEVLDDRGRAVGPGSMGRVVLTDLFNHAMPLIRYDIGDMAVVGRDEACGCGSALPRLERILGRDRDIIVAADGSPRVGYLFVECIRRFDLPSRFQVDQQSRRRLVLRIERPAPSPDVIGRLVTALSEIVGPGVEVGTEVVERIPRDPSGKYRYVTSGLTAWDTDRNPAADE